MNVTPSIFQQVGCIFLSSKTRRDAEYADFLAFHKELVEKMDGDVASAVGNVPVACIENGKDANYGIVLTVADYLFWKEKIASGARFKKSIEQVKSDILMRLAKAAENNKLTADERKALLALLDT